MIELKNNKGITLVALIITVILMLILASVAAYSGTNIYKEMQVTKFITQMQLIQTKIDELVEDKKTENIGEDISADEEKKKIINFAYSNGEIKSATEDYKNKFRYMSKENIETQLNIDNIEDDILVNFETREVVSLNGVEYKNKRYYTQYKLPNGQVIVYNESITRNTDFSTSLLVNGLNASVTINNIDINNGTLSFAEVNSEGKNINWQTITNYTEKGKQYTANLSKSGSYMFQLEDNTNKENSKQKTIEIVLTNKPKTNSNLESYNYGSGDSFLWAYVESNGELYLWIPRFAYDSNNNIKFIKGNSKVSTDNIYISDEWTIHNKFKDNGEELTGVWVQTGRQSGLNMIELLNSDLQTLKEINE